MKFTWNKKTNLVHSGNRRSQFNEVSEAIFLTQSYLYETAEDAEKRFASDVPNDEFIYTRYGNPLSIIAVVSWLCALITLEAPGFSLSFDLIFGTPY